MSEYQFSGQKDDEKVILVIRQSPWVFFYPGLIVILVIALYLAFFYFFQNKGFAFYSAMATLIIVVYIISRTWFVWWSQVYLITSDRVLSVEQKGWFDRSMSESNLENILFINHEVKGPVQTMFNFGNVRIRASGVVEDELVFTNVYNPYEVQQEIVKAQKEKTGNIASVHESTDKKEEKVVLR
ncbi:hypothetical protein A3F08_00920 [Candidatus Berkelbacteria bacterium RIFCSPHIGHO2_12_FULL_36_9]|uniref:DUF304 domain-containing protein n=1 Tax=Candidatus Berkelbacteria bacterium RIFCSPHIGHO2_12_FULL_36_9 TaxID=1797469 RepID=A0A1F5EIA3_9BACT|nr:MAG: hypothetical protein A3F08_00920 [Candidatus Berkelbacteria bacterium RIFCSPHIGHO2_12_FULL_36_9]